MTTKIFTIKTNLYLALMFLTKKDPPAIVSLNYTKANSALLHPGSPVPIPQQCYISLQKNPDTNIQKKAAKKITLA